MNPGEVTSRPGPWKRPWVRRVTYLLAAGTVLTGLATWTVRRPFVTAWVLKELGKVVRAETGLALEVEDLEISLLAGRLVLHRVSWGDDFLKVKRIEAVADFWSLRGSRPHLHSLQIDEPRFRLTRAALDQLKFRKRPPSETPVKVMLGYFLLTDGRLEVQDPGLPAASVDFRASARGLGLNHVTTTLQLDRISLAKGNNSLSGRARFDADLSETDLKTAKVELHLGRSTLTAAGAAGFARKDLKIGSEAKVDLAEIAPFLPTGELAGSAELKATLSGSFADPVLDLELQGRDLASAAARLQPGNLKLKGKAGAARVQLAGLDWESPEGRLHVEGEWRKGIAAKVRMAAQDVDLGPAVAITRVGFLKEFRVSFEGDATLPADLTSVPRLDRIAATTRLAFSRNGQPAGSLSLQLADGNMDIPEFDFKAPELDLMAKGKLRLGARGIEAIQGAGRVRTEAAEVAKALTAWKIVTLDMGGRADAQATVSWDRTQGLRIDGTGEVKGPRWQKARVEKLQAEVKIRGSELWVGNTELFSGDGRGWGELWLDWGKVRPGADTLDLCYRAFRLPIAEGLRAADDGKNQVGELPIAGLGSAWVRLRGDWDHLYLTGEGLFEEGRVYGLRLPAGRASLDFDLSQERLRIPEFRLAETVAQLGEEGGNPEGFLALKGALDMDLARQRWSGRIGGTLDSTLLEFPGPRFQANLDGRIEGPWTQPFGPLELPAGWVNFSQGRLLVGDQSVEDLRGSVRLQDGNLTAEIGSAGHERPILALAALDVNGKAMGDVSLRIAPETTDTGRLAQRLTGDLLQNAVADLRAEGILDTKGLRWQGQIQELTGYFQGFTLSQAKMGTLAGGTASATVDLFLEGHRNLPDPAPVSGPQKATMGIQLGGTVPFSTTAPVDLSLKGTGELANLKTILDHLLDLENTTGLLADLQPEGKASLDLRATGSFAEPMLDGTLDLVDGRLRLRTFPQTIEDVIFTIRFKGRDILLSEEDPLIGTFAQGSLGLWGRASWGLGGLTDYDLSARLDEFSLRDLPQGFDLRGSLEANLSGNDRAGGVLRGKLLAESMAYHTDITIRDLILGGSMGSAPELAGLDPDDPLGRIDLDLDLVLAQPWDFDTNLLKIKGRPEGAFKVRGTLARPGLLGRMDFLPGGRLTNLLPAGDVVLERGSINFVDPTVVNPLINLEGRIDVPPYLVTITINGTLDQLNFVPTSTPGLRQDEIVAILIDPAAAPSIGTSTAPNSQSAMSYGLASASSGLLATLAFANFGETLRKTLKLDRVNPVVRTGSTGTLESSITVGKTFELFGSRTPIIGTYSRSGSLVTLSGQVEWRFGNFILQFGASSSEATGIKPTGEIRHTWSPR